MSVTSFFDVRKNGLLLRALYLGNYKLLPRGLVTWFSFYFDIPSINARKSPVFGTRPKKCCPRSRGPFIGFYQRRILRSAVGCGVLFKPPLKYGKLDKPALLCEHIEFLQRKMSEIVS